MTERHDGICPDCQKKKPLINNLNICVECLIARKAFDAMDNGDIQKPYVQPLLNSSKVEPKDVTFEVIKSLWDDSKADYWRKFLESKAKNDT